jgi:hypothetical protein
MATTSTASPATITSKYTNSWGSNFDATTLSTRTSSSYRRTTTTTTTTSVPSACSIYSETWYSAATSYFGTDPKPTVCGGSGYNPTYTSSPGITFNDQLNAQLDAEIRALDRKIKIKIIALSVVGALFVLLTIISIVFAIRKRRRQRAEKGNLAEEFHHHEQGIPPNQAMRGQEQGIIDAQNAMTTATHPRATK